MDCTLHQLVIPFEFNGIKIALHLPDFTIHRVSVNGHQEILRLKGGAG
jgi:hypothetical protein